MIPYFFQPEITRAEIVEQGHGTTDGALKCPKIKIKYKGYLTVEFNARFLGAHAIGNTLCILWETP